jgi:3'-phosphoadenosine 5'-phosphosulfate sulfotransferase (PAPS reductase)/FAD synthetase
MDDGDVSSPPSTTYAIFYNIYTITRRGGIDKVAGLRYDDYMLHVVGLSGGKDSTAMAVRLRQLQPDQEFTYICTPTGNEPQEMVDHWFDLEHRLRSPLQKLTNNTLEYWIEHYRALPNWRQRWCTRLLKILPTIEFLTDNAPCVAYVGLRADEDEREGIYGVIPGVTQVYPMRDDWEWIESDVWRFLAAEGIKIPARTDCEWCFGQRLIEWKRLWQNKPHSYARAVELERRMGATFR